MVSSITIKNPRTEGRNKFITRLCLDCVVMLEGIIET